MERTDTKKELDFCPTPLLTVSEKRGSNPRPSAWEADALPLSYSRKMFTGSNLTHFQIRWKHLIYFLPGIKANFNTLNKILNALYPCFRPLGFVNVLDNCTFIGKR